MAKEKFVHSWKVTYEEDAEDCIIYLNNKLESEYAKVFFLYAKDHGSAPLEDQGGRKYELTYERGVYILTRKQY